MPRTGDRFAPRAPFEHKHIEARTGHAVGRDAPTETAPDGPQTS